MVDSAADVGTDPGSGAVIAVKARRCQVQLAVEVDRDAPAYRVLDTRHLHRLGRGQGLRTDWQNKHPQQEREQAGHCSIRPSCLQSRVCIELA